MKLTKEITMDLMRWQGLPPIDVALDDRFSRAVSVTLTADGTPWMIPADATVLIRYRKADGTGGVYDTMPDGSRAWTAEENRITVQLAPQVMTVPGTVGLTVTLLRQDVQLSTFLLLLSVHGDDQEIQSEETYHYVSAFLPMPESAAVGRYLQIADVDALGNVQRLEAVELKLETVNYTAQELTQQQKDQARRNIGAMADTAVPAVTAEDEGCFLRVRNGKWAAAAMEQAEEVLF